MTATQTLTAQKACRDCGKGFAPEHPDFIVCPNCVRAGMDKANDDWYETHHGHGDGCPSTCSCWL